jgi:predicted nucleic acid-binding protein
MITLGELSQGLIHFERAIDDGVYELSLGAPDTLFENATNLSNRHALEFGLRYLDMLHIASALQLNAKRFLTFDTRQAKLAKAVGLQVKP